MRKRNAFYALLGAGGLVVAGLFVQSSAATAAGGLGKHVVEQKNIAPQAVSWNKIKPGAVNETRLSGAVQDKLNTKGQDGKDGVAGYDVYGPTVVAENGWDQITLACDDAGAEGKVAIGGGVKVDSGGTPSDVTVNGSYPSDIADAGDDGADGIWRAGSWTVDFTTTKAGVAVQPFVVCVAAN